MAGRARRRRRRSVRDASHAKRARAQDGFACGTGLQQLTPWCRAGERRRASERRTGSPRFDHHSIGPRSRGAGRRSARRRPRRLRCARSNRGSQTNRAIRLHREPMDAIPLDRPCIVACGPLPSEALLANIDRVLASAASHRTRLHYFDAASPIVSTDSIDESLMYRKSRYEKGDGDDYLNIPLDKEQYAQLIHDLRTLPRHEGKDFEEGTKYFEGCLPIEVMADRGEETLRFGPMKPVGLRHPRNRYHAVRRNPTAQRKHRRYRAEHRGFPNPHDVARAKRSLRKAPRAAKRGMASPGSDAPQHLHRLAAPARRATQTQRNRGALLRRPDHRR